MKLSDAQVSVLRRLEHLTSGKPIDRAPTVRFAVAQGLERRGLATLVCEDRRGWVVTITEDGRRALADLDAQG